MILINDFKVMINHPNTLLDPHIFNEIDNWDDIQDNGSKLDKFICRYRALITNKICLAIYHVTHLFTQFGRNDVVCNQNVCIPTKFIVKCYTFFIRR